MEHSNSLVLSQKDRFIDNIVASLNGDTLLLQFATQYLRANSTSGLFQDNDVNIEVFLKERFDFFISAIPAGNVRLATLESEDLSGNGRRLLEYVVPDAMYMVLTLGEVFKEYDCRITKLIHPILAVRLDRDADGETVVSSISEPDEESFLVSTTYIEFEGLENDQLDKFLGRIKRHIDALQSAQLAQTDLFRQLRSMSKNIMENPLGSDQPKEEWVDLVSWLDEENFSVFGASTVVHSALGTTVQDGLGILSESYRALDPSIESGLVEHSWKLRQSDSPYIFDTFPVISPIQRFEPLMRLSIKCCKDNAVIEYNFVGLLKRSSLLAKNWETPLIHLKMKTIFESRRMFPGSYDYNEVIRIFTSIPKAELFRCSTDDLQFVVDSVLSITNPSALYCYSKVNASLGRTLLLVSIPEALYSRSNIDLISQYLQSTIQTVGIEIVEIDGPDHKRLHFYFDSELLGSAAEQIDKIQGALRDLIRPWEDRLRDAILAEFPGKTGLLLHSRYLHAFPSHHKVRRTPAETVNDIIFLEKVTHERRIQFDLAAVTTVNSSLKDKASVLSIYNTTKIDLIHIMPVLQNLGLYVFDELTTRIGPESELYGYIHSFRFGNGDQSKLDEKIYKTLINTLLTEVFEGNTENDSLNALAISAQMDWRAINLFQTYRNLFCQLVPEISREKVNSVLQRYPDSVVALFQYFQIKFSPDPEFGTVQHREANLLTPASKGFFSTLSTVSDVNEDLILKQIFNLFEATLRTNFYVVKNAADTSISIKLDSKKVPFVPAPAPYREIYVHDVGMEGTHLRFGPIARGGLRWSDRHDDFRKEVLGLVKTQQTKNVVIVPVGSKGGFVVKKPLISKDVAATESVKQYRKFIGALLDITDNITGDGETSNPHNVLAYDGLDPYLVVAADKGTASFSDIANDMADRYRFWLGDAFASGGSIGYNHKKEAITARGAWECVKLHFLELGKNIENDQFTAVGIGDMSGDVFGNGMLLSKNLRLLAAFNHAHVFVDPTPDSQTSWTERKRLFDLPRSAWTDYDHSLISNGGGVFERNAKEILVSPEMKDVFGIKEATVTGEGLIRYILKAKVDLVWLGGIGTYFKASSQSNVSVGDVANDSVRIDITDCKAQVIGEGANLGVTQPARIEYALSGGRINTDAIDNSAGVNMSDYEVNIKILLRQLLEVGVLKDNDDRNSLLELATNEVSELVLANNRGQHRLLSCDAIRSKKQFSIFVKLIQSYVGSGFLDSKTEQLPDFADLEAMGGNGHTMPRPILATVQAYTKMMIYDQLMAADILDDPYFKGFYEGYFPLSIRNRVGISMPNHRLQRNILGTILTNRIVNQAGILFFFQSQQATGKAVADIAKAYYLLDSAYNFPELRRTITRDTVAEVDKYAALIELENHISDWVQTLLLIPAFDINFEYSRLIQSISSEILGRVNLSRSGLSKWANRGFSDSNVKQIASLDLLNSVPEVVFLHVKYNIPLGELVINAMDLIEQKFELRWLELAVKSIDAKTQWEIAHKGILLQTIKMRKLALVKLALEYRSNLSIDEIIKQIISDMSSDFKLYFGTVSDLKSSRTSTLTSITVAVNRLNFIGA
ncbi:hypothetical protein EB093_02460 [bacterium]|nr:hypothetical protein [bacterium]